MEQLSRHRLAVGCRSIRSHNRKIWYFADNAAANRICHWKDLVATAYCT